MASIERQASRIETLVNDFEKQINYSLDKFTEANYLNEKFFEDFGHMYMFQMGMLMHLKVDREDIRGMQIKEMHMPKRTILRGKSREQYYSTF
jgi:hypothetical protein